MIFSIDPSTIDFKQTRHGVNATAAIVRNSTERVGKIHDMAERIVTEVTFVSTEAQAAFVAEAKLNHPVVFGRTDHNDSVFASEYARALLSQAEQQLLASLSTKP